MPTIEAYGWEFGFCKISNTEFLVVEFGYSLSHAKALTNELLNGKSYHLESPNYLHTEQILKLLKMFGVKARVLSK
jgi:hypothetical protein